ncbi:hypothetical protein CLV46_3067 [Diaminobutyricimonas aerilata]|uniref:Uncharacterized protein n=1 Tax=Diaminobutyricimonas aerilata TaxID=1162967 RepID=A0A2M9CNJ5_9MICO|nr:hypothetical protein [Diaminobutyricimonas aerilata]PJJ73475.1 hypothetical protein CLV46_3067 [Diaminobutyricimonas aerilata]
MYGLNFFSIVYPLLMLVLVGGAIVLLVLLCRLLLAARTHLIAATRLTELRTDLLLAGDDDDTDTDGSATRA